MNISAVNLNDAVYLLLNRKFDWLTGVTISNFSQTSCPLLHNFDRKEVVTYKDWAAILAGNQSVLDTSGAARETRCLGLSDYAPWTVYRPWGRTFGKYKGPNGKPLAEVKPLDEMFWYYDALDRNLRNTISNVTNASRVMYYYYHTSGWQFQYMESGTGVVSNGNAVVPLYPGVYGACNMSHDRDTGFDVLDETGPVQGNIPFIRTYRAGTWGYQNSIFFVDSPVYIKPWWAGGSHFQGVIFRITPPGYWTN